MSSCQKNVKYQPDILIVQLQYQMKRHINPHQTYFLPHFLGKPTNFSYLIFFSEPTNFSYLIFLGNPLIFPTSFFWETHQFFLPHFVGKSTNLVIETLEEPPPHEVFGYYLSTSSS